MLGLDRVFNDVVRIPTGGVNRAPLGWERELTALKSRVASPFAAIWVATFLLFVVSPFVASGSLGHAALQGMLPFAGILAIAAIGQTLVIQQGGLDLSVPGIFSMGAVLDRHHPRRQRGRADPGAARRRPGRPRGRPAERDRRHPLRDHAAGRDARLERDLHRRRDPGDRRLDRLQGDEQLADLHRRQGARHPDPRRDRGDRSRSSSRSSSPARSGDGASSWSARARSPPAPPASRSSATSSAPTPAPASPTRSRARCSPATCSRRRCCPATNTCCRRSPRWCSAAPPSAAAAAA